MNLKYILTGLLCVILIGSVMLARSGDQETPAGMSFQVQTFQSGTGWGYEILRSGQPLIKQPYIPAVPGEKPFRNQAEANKAGNLVLQKIKHHKTPALSVYELDSLKIQLK
ncbi:protein of unknown function [Gracilimonas mengyeensis]|uniref:DUF4907 domain-containing protein n=2 Tax=Gracilimonas mengyeensis TaxID=1302730 RepID=A0A521BV46_9BACT|nr:protein of unknown function [Gracilimonas mengyeensis]